LPEKALCGPVLFRAMLIEVPHAALIGLPRVEPLGRLAQRALLLASASAGSMTPATLAVISSCTAKMSLRSRS
jgi:hypothetical protein